MSTMTTVSVDSIKNHAPLIMVLASYMDSEGPLPHPEALNSGLIEPGAWKTSFGRHVLRVEEVSDRRGHVWWPSNSFEALHDIGSMVVLNDAG
jgi:hypothetical protein